MDPNLFHLNYERLAEVLIAIVFLSLVVERALSILFESRAFIEKTEDGRIVTKMKNIDAEQNPEEYAMIAKRKKKKGIKESLSFVVAVAVCWIVQFDALTISFVSSDTMSEFGYIFTGAIVAGGSKGSIKLFQDWIGFMSSAEKQRQDLKNDNDSKS